MGQGNPVCGDRVTPSISHVALRVAHLETGLSPESLLGVGGNRFPFSRLTDQTSHFSFSATKYTCVSQEPLRQ